MPRVIDKIIINEATTDGSYGAIKQEYKSLRTLAGEIEAAGNGGAAENLAFRDRLKALCDAHNAADNDYKAGLQGLLADMAAYIDSKPPLPVTPAP